MIEPAVRRRLPQIVFFLGLIALPACKDKPSDAAHRVLEIDIDDHGLAGLWAANAPHLKGLIARGVYGYTRVIVPTHSNQSNYALVTAQYPDGNDVPGNSWLDRSLGFKHPIDLGPISLGNYGFWDQNPLRTRGESLYKLGDSIGADPAYFGELPPFEAGATNVHFTIVGAKLAGFELDKDTATGLVEQFLKYPADVVAAAHLDGPGAPGESLSHFTFSAAAQYIQATPEPQISRYIFLWDFIALDGDPTGEYGADGPELQKVIEDYDDALGQVLAALDDKGMLENTDILFTLDHGKVNTHQQVALGSHGNSATKPADGQLGALLASMGASVGLTVDDYDIENEDGDAQIYARVQGAGTPAGHAEQVRVTHALVDLIQSGKLTGVDTTRTITWDGYKGTRRFHDYHADGPYQADILVFPQDDWTLNQVDSTNTTPGPFQEHTDHPYGRHGGFSTDELYVPIIMAGPSFKSGVMLPHPVNHVDVAATAAQLLAGKNLSTATGAPIRAALLGDPGETVPQPTGAMDGSRDLILARSGFTGAPAPAGAAAQAAIVVDVAGVYFDELFVDANVPMDAVAPWRALAAQGTSFENAYNRYRDWPVNEYELLVGGYPVQDPWIPFAEDDPAQTGLPGWGLLQMPVPAGFVSDPAGTTAWRAATSFGRPSLFDAARDLGLSTALLGKSDFHALHLDATTIDTVKAVDDASVAGEVGTFLGAHPKSLIVVALGGTRTEPRTSAAAGAELKALGDAVQAIAAAAPDALLVVTSRGATTIDDASADAYGPQSSRHVPLIVRGPNVRAGVVSGMPAQAADVPATVLFGLGHAARADFVEGTWAAGAPVGGIPAPVPAGASAGRALVTAFTLR